MNKRFQDSPCSRINNSISNRAVFFLALTAPILIAVAGCDLGFKSEARYWEEAASTGTPIHIEFAKGCSFPPGYDDFTIEPNKLEEFLGASLLDNRVGILNCHSGSGADGFAIWGGATDYNRAANLLRAKLRELDLLEDATIYVSGIVWEPDKDE